MSLQNPCSHHSHEDTYCWGNGSHVREITRSTDEEGIILSVHVFPAYWHEGLDTLCQEPTPTCPQLAVSSALRCMKLCDALLSISSCSPCPCTYQSDTRLGYGLIRALLLKLTLNRIASHITRESMLGTWTQWPPGLAAGFCAVS